MQIHICICFNQFSLSFVVWYLIFQEHRKDTADTVYVTFSHCMSKKSCPFLSKATKINLYLPPGKWFFILLFFSLILLIPAKSFWEINFIAIVTRYMKRLLRLTVELKRICLSCRLFRVLSLLNPYITKDTLVYNLCY